MDSIHAGRRAMLRGHEANAGLNRDYNSIGNAMAVRSDENSSAFQGAGVFMPDIHNIAKDLDEEELELKEKKEAKKRQKKAVQKVDQNVTASIETATGANRTTTEKASRQKI